MMRVLRLAVTLVLGFYLFAACTTTKQMSDSGTPKAGTVAKTTQAEKPTDPYVKEIYQPAYTKKFNLVHTKLEVSFDWEKRYLFGKATIQLTPHFYPQEELILDAKGFDIHEILLLEGDRKQALAYEYDGRKIAIKLGQSVSKGQIVTLFIDYTAKTYEIKAGGSEAILEDRGLYFINHDGSESGKPQQIWTQGETEASSCWFPTIDAPNQKTTQEMYITVQDRFKTLSNGDLVYSQINEDSTRTDYWRMKKPHAPYLFMMAIGEFEIVKDEYEGLLVDYYVESEYAAYAKDIFGDTPEMIKYFSERLGYDYPWSKYSQIVVRDYVSGAMENTTASLFMEEVQMTRRELLDEDYVDVIAHELFHQWFGDLVTCESWPNLTLNEGFASYSEYLWTEHKKEKKDAEAKLFSELNAYLSESGTKNVDLIRFDYDDKEKMFDNHSYAKGGLVLHMLRDYVGDEAFFASLNRYLKDHEYGSVEVHDLRLAFEAVTGEDLNWFFNQWFLAKGHPVLDVQDHYVDSTHTLYIYTHQTQNLEEFPLYRIPVDVSIYSGEEKVDDIIWVENVSDTFKFSIDKKPSLVLINSTEDLVAEISHEKSLNEWIVQSEKAENAISRYKAYVYLVQDTIHDLSGNIHKGLADEFEDIQVLVLDYARESGDSLITAWERDIVKLGKDGSTTEVKSEALFTLFESKGYSYLDLYRAAAKDSSFLVAGSGLYAILQISDSVEEKNELVNRFINETNVSVVLPLANYFLLSGDTSRLDWFVDKTKRGKTETQYYLLRMIGQYMMGLDTSNVDAGIELLSDIALNNNKYYLRIAAFQSLQLFEDNQFAKEKIDQIVMNEKDERVRRFFN